MTSVLHVLQLTIASVFALAAISKLRHPRRFLVVVEGYRVVPARAAGLTALVILSIEAAIAVSFATGLALEAGGTLALFALSAFAAAIVVNLHRGRRIACGCFGAKEEVSYSTLVRVAVLAAAVAAVLALLAIGTVPFKPHHYMWPTSSQAAQALAIGIAAYSFILVGIWLLYLARLLELRRRLRHAASHQSRA